MSFQSYSILIPHIFINIPIHKIKDSFEKLDLGKIERIDSVIKISREGYNYRMAFIHFEYWNMNNIAAINLREKIENPNKEAKLVYDDPWYWLLLPNKSIQNYVNNDFEKLKITLENQIQRIKNKVNCIYEELYQREYIPTEKELEWCNDSLHTFAPIHPMENDYNDNESILSEQTYNSECKSIYYNTKIDNETNKYNKNIYIYEDKLHLPLENRTWMTINICDNA